MSPLDAELFIIIVILLKQLARYKKYRIRMFLDPQAKLIMCDGLLTGSSNLFHEEAKLNAKNLCIY